MKFACPESQKRGFLKWGSMVSGESSGGGSAGLDASDCVEVSGLAVEGASGCWAGAGIALTKRIARAKIKPSAAARSELSSLQ